MAEEQHKQVCPCKCQSYNYVARKKSLMKIYYYTTQT